MFAYPEDFELADRMSRLAREELRHFELVQQKMIELDSAVSSPEPVALRGGPAPRAASLGARSGEWTCCFAAR